MLQRVLLAIAAPGELILGFEKFLWPSTMRTHIVGVGGTDAESAGDPSFGARKEFNRAPF